MVAVSRGRTRPCGSRLTNPRRQWHRATAAFGLALAGYGQYSLDAWLGIAQRLPTVATWIVLALGIVGRVANLALRRRSTTAARV